MGKLKVKIICANEKYKEIENKLKKAGFEISDDADFVFKDLEFKQSSFIGYANELYEVIELNRIIYFEAFDHDVYIKTKEKTFKIKEKLYEVELLLIENGFIRINKSQVININAIKTIKPSLNSRMNLIMKNNELLYVTRVYTQKFKELIGFK